MFFFFRGQGRDRVMGSRTNELEALRLAREEKRQQEGAGAHSLGISHGTWDMGDSRNGPQNGWFGVENPVDRWMMTGGIHIEISK